MIRKLTPICRQKKITTRSSSGSSKTYKPKTRIESLKEKGVVFPKSSKDKIVFIAKSEGNNFPAYVPVETMKRQIDRVCFEQWRNVHESMKKDPFKKLQFKLKMLYCLISVLMLVLFLVIRPDASYLLATSQLLYTIIALTGIILAICFYIYSTNCETYKPDKNMINAIRNQLALFNQEEIRESENRPKFTWTCHKQCLWIAITHNG